MTTEEMRLLQTIGALDHFLIGVLDPVLREMGLGREHWHVLRLLAAGRGMPMGEIAQSLSLPRATATRVIDVLVAQMLVFRRSDPVDRRRVLVHLTAGGEESLGRSVAALREHTGPALETLDADERARLGRLVEQLLQQSPNKMAIPVPTEHRRVL